MVDINRAQRIGEQMRHEIGRILLHEINDPRLKLIAVTDIEVSRDLSHAKIYFTIAQQDKNIDKSTIALNKAASFLRVRLAEELNFRVTPKLRFVYDASVEEGRRIAALIDDAVADDE